MPQDVRVNPEEVAVIKRKDASSSKVQLGAEPLVLKRLEVELGVELEHQRRVDLGDSWVKPDGAAPDNSVFVEVLARIGKLKGGQERKVSMDALKLLGLREFHPKARLFLAFVDQQAADSIVGWKAALLERQGIERRVVEIDPRYRALISEAQARQDLFTG
jgi:hypothetical protein